MSVQIDPLLADNVKLGEESTSLVYDGESIAGLTTEIKIFKISIYLVNAHGTSSYIQTVLVYPLQEELSLGPAEEATEAGVE